MLKFQDNWEPCKSTTNRLMLTASTNCKVDTQQLPVRNKTLDKDD